jgi:hypothetical protein
VSRCGRRQCEAHFTTHVMSVFGVSARISPPFVRSLFLPAVSKRQPYNWKMPLPQQPPEPMWGASESPFDVADPAAFQPAPQTLGTQAIPPVTGQVLAPMMTTAKYQGLRIARSNRPNMQDPREEFTFQIPSPNVHAPQEAANVAARIVEPSLSKPFMFRGLSPSASVLHSPPTPVQQAWSGSNTPSYAVGHTAGIQGMEQSFGNDEQTMRLIDTSEPFLIDDANVEHHLIKPIVKDMATIFWRVDQGTLEEKALIAHSQSRLAGKIECTDTFQRYLAPRLDRAFYESPRDRSAARARQVSAVDRGSSVDEHHSADPW